MPTMRPHALAILAHALLTVSAVPTKQAKLPVCIIGAGPAGLTAAAKLQEKGIDAVIFDKQDAVGGKCQAYYDQSGLFHPLGAAFYSNATYPETVKVIQQTNVTVEEFALAGTRQQYFFNTTAFNTFPVPGFPPQFLQLIAAEIPRYIALYARVFAPISTVGYDKGVPAELTVPAAQWFRTNNFTALPTLLVNPLALYGYGDINQVPALYVLQYFTPDILTAFVGQHNVYYTDFHKIWIQYAQAKASRQKLKLSSEVRCIDRSGNNPVVKYTRPAGNFYAWETQTCASLIFAFPPSIADLERAGLDLTEAEYDVFSNVGTFNYYSSAVELALPYGVSYIAQNPNPNTPPPNFGEPVAVLRLNQRSNVSIAWSTGPYDGYQDPSVALNLLNTTMSALNKDPRNATAQGMSLTSTSIRAFRQWDYFPHFSSQPLKDGAYAKLKQLQGCNKTFFASSLQGMEIVEWAIRAGQQVVQCYF